MQPTNQKKIVKKATGIRLTPTRSNTIVEVTVDFGAFGSGQFFVRPLLYTEIYRQNIDAKMQELIAAGDGSTKAMDAITEYLLPLIADWEIYAPFDQVVQCQEITVEEEIDKLKAEITSSPTGTVTDEEDGFEVTLYKLPVNAKSMRLFPVLGNTSGIDAILKAIATVPSL